MRVGKTKWVYLNFIPYEFKGIEEYLETLALKGWKLVNIKGDFLKFKKIKPMNLKYTVDVIDEIAFIDGTDTEISMEYRDYCTMAGWEFIGEKGKIQIYCRELSEEIIPIHTDERERFEVIKKATIKYEFQALIINLIFIYCASRYTLNGNFLADNLILIYLSTIGIKIIRDIIQFIHFMRWNIKAEKSLEKGDKVSYESRYNINIRRVLDNYISLALIGLLIAMTIDGGAFAIKILILFSIIGVMPYIIRHFLNKSHGDNIKRRNLYRSTTALLFILEIIVVQILFSSGILNYEFKSKDAISNKVNTITIEDLGLKIKNHENTYIEENSSIFADVINYNVESNEGYMGYELFKSRYKWAIDYKLKKERSTLKRLGIDYEEVKTKYSTEDIKIYSNKYGNSIKILSDNIYFEISCWDEDMINSDILEIVMKKLFMQA